MIDLKQINLHRVINYPLIVAIFIFSLGCNTQLDKAGVVSAASPEAVEVGIKILEAGGNAVDAAVAIAFALAVTEPALSGLGGQIQILVRLPDSEPFLINGTSYAPSVLPKTISKKDLVKHKASTIPSILKVLYYSWNEYGSGNIEWNELLHPAIEYAHNGFDLGEFRYKILQYKKDELGKDSITKKLFLHKDGTVAGKNHIWKQLILAKTLDRIARTGEDDFYSGKIARQIADDMVKNDGWITLNDLIGLQDPKVQKPIKGSYRDYEIFTMPPPGGGWVIIQALNILEQFDNQKLRINSKERLKLISQALQLAHISRKNYPVKKLNNFDEEIGEKISKEEAKNLFEKLTNGETTHFSVVDKDGMLVSATSSINNYFGSKTASLELGFLYNDYMNEYKINEPGHPFNLSPGAMPYSSMTPTILVKDGKPVMAVGSPGSERIISAIVQVISLWIDAGLSIEDAVAYPRIHVTPDSVIYLESNDYSGEEISSVKDAGFRFDSAPSEIIINNLNPYFGGVHAVAYENNQWKGAADPRRDGAVGYHFNK